MGAGAPEARAGEGGSGTVQGTEFRGMCPMHPTPCLSSQLSWPFPSLCSRKGGSLWVTGVLGCLQGISEENQSQEPGQPRVREPLYPRSLSPLSMPLLFALTSHLLHHCYQVNHNPLQDLNMIQFLLFPAHEFSQSMPTPAETPNFSGIAMRFKCKAQFR